MKKVFCFTLLTLFLVGLASAGPLVCPETQATCEIEPVCEVNESAGGEESCPSYGTGYCEGTLNIIYFYQIGCTHCEVVNYLLDDLEANCDLNITKLEVRFNSENRDLFLWYANKTGTPVGTPLIAIGPYALSGEYEIRDKLDGVINKCIDECCECIVINHAYTHSQPPAGDIVSLFTIAASGLTDGINPCAFAVLIFFLSYLNVVGRSMKTMLLSGVSYITAVFLTYLVLGLGLLTLIRSFEIQGVIQLPIAFFTLFMGLVSFADAYRSRKGSAKEMTIKMPSHLRGVVNSIIREKVRSPYLVVVSFALGILVAMFELPCTGEVYLPILSILSHHGVWAALPLLLFYNFMFILPLLGLFAVIYRGAESQKIAKWVSKNTVLMKILVGVVLVALGLYLLWLNKEALMHLI